MPTSTASAATSATRSRSASTSRARAGRRRRPPPRWEGLDVARGIAVALAAVLATAALLAPGVFGPTSWRGLTLVDLVPGLFLVVAGAGAGWRHDVGGTWSARRRWRRACVLVAAGSLVAIARAHAEVGRLAADELLRLAAATGLAAAALRLPRWLLVPAAGVLLLVPAAVVTGDPVGRGLAAVDHATGWGLEAALGLSRGGVPLASLPAAVALVLVGHGFGTWAHRRPPGPATGAALATVGAWCLVGAVIVGQVLVPVPALLNLPVASAAVGLAALVLAAGHLAATWGQVPGLAATGRAALPLVVLGAVVVALIPAGAPPSLPVVPALTAGGAVAAALIAAGRRIGRSRWILRA